jgi:hypothetical protein
MTASDHAHKLKMTTEMLILPLFVLFLINAPRVLGHGHLIEPKSRNYRASLGSWWCPTCDPYTTPMMESCPHCMNNYGGTLSSLCGISQTDANDNYDFPKSTNGSPLPWQSQAVYNKGSVITVTIGIASYHGGHIEMFACPRSQSPSQACFNQYPLQFVSDAMNGAVPDPNYPGRAYVSPDAPLVNSIRTYIFAMKLPSTLPSGDVLIQWMYITANSCNPPGYSSYPFPWPSAYNSWLGACQSSGSNSWNGERFWNCAEVTVSETSSLAPAPTQSPSHLPTEKPIRRPTRKPTGKPIRRPTRKPTGKPIRRPTRKPTGKPIRRPTGKPIRRPTRKPIRRPTRKPTRRP